MNPAYIFIFHKDINILKNKCITDKIIKMEAFYYILQKHMLSKKPILPNNGLFDYWNHIFNNERETITACDRFSNMHFYCFIDACYKDIKRLDYEPVCFSDIVKIKLGNLLKIMDSMFVLNKDEPLLFFCKAQRSYWAFSRLAYRYRLKKSPTRNTMDLYMNPIDVSKPSSMVIFQDGAKYYFRIPDLINIIDQALLNHCHHFHEPLYPKNPYTNIEFSEAILLNIYQNIRYSNFKFPVLLHYFYLSSFNVDDFLYDYESAINELHIKDFTFKSSSDVLYEDVQLLIKICDQSNILDIDEDFPMNRLVDIMRPYLYLHYIYQYSISSTEKRENALSMLKQRFDAFIDFNPHFGKKKLHKKPGSKFYNVLSFNDNHINFNAD
jgi:hypothetical protein